MYYLVTIITSLCRHGTQITISDVLLSKVLVKSHFVLVEMLNVSVHMNLFVIFLSESNWLILIFFVLIVNKKPLGKESYFTIDI